jgi:hypothetical protein
MIRKYFTTEEMEVIYEEEKALKEDLEFFKLYIKRNKKSKMSFDLIPTVSNGRKLMEYLYKNYYQYSFDELKTMLMELKVAEKFLWDVYNEKEVNLEIYDYFATVHEINISYYASDFIGCSRGAMGIERRLEQLLKTRENVAV